ncbi:hypothetical protein [Bacillus smithii]|jgi:hypothetical protein|uniref:hypothetical protein n=1 Tax=Bacillus smithii TaxID=1479 RepID=UPI000B22DBF8|nr:hypothetical protein [Bacillus smithii]MED4884402.1 hypothetical protein [Bacillus smithii]MED4928458.1 hypothetical protein [Bacillus smithii]
MIDYLTLYLHDSKILANTIRRIQGMAELAHDSKAFSLVKGDSRAGIEKGSKIKASTEMLKSFFVFNTTKIARDHMPCMRICVFEDDLKRIKIMRRTFIQTKK